MCSRRMPVLRVVAAVVAAVGDVSEESEADVESETEAGEENES